METQTIAEYEVRPAGIVEQLLEIAEKYDCMSEIGNATSWRWKEGIITRMPKTKTVARILTAAFGSKDPVTWYKNTSGDLNWYIKNNFGLQNFSKALEGTFIDDIYDSLLILQLGSGEGKSFDELVYSFCFIRYARSLEDTEYYTKPSEEKILEAYGEWANKKVEECLKKTPHLVKLGLYHLEEMSFFSSERHQENIIELNKLRLKVVGYNSHFDIWRTLYIDLSNDDAIQMERELIQIYDKFFKKSIKVRDDSRKLGKMSSAKTRVFNFNSFTLPSGKEEWKCN